MIHSLNNLASSILVVVEHRIRRPVEVGIHPVEEDNLAVQVVAVHNHPAAEEDTHPVEEDIRHPEEDTPEADTHPVVGGGPVEVGHTVVAVRTRLEVDCILLARHIVLEEDDRLVCLRLLHRKKNQQLRAGA